MASSSSSPLILNNSQSSLMASSSSSLPRTWRYRIFTSFHGTDVRITFLSHLRKEFENKGIRMFNDEGIDRGHTIAPALIEAIRQSRISIVVLSKNYASSSWCLDELVEILDCKETLGQIVMTVFYDVDPSHVRKQTEDFGRVFQETCQKKTEEDKRRWSQALYYVGNIAGEHFQNWSNEAKMIEKIAKDVSDKLNLTPSWDFDAMVGLETHLREMASMLDLDYNGVKIVAICGPAGIGKTTIARALQSLISHRFQLTFFVENLRGSYPSGLDEYGLKFRLQEHLLSKILNQDDTKICNLGAVKERLCDLKVLIILDDVNDIKQLEALANETTWFGPGSRIIVTTENKKLLQQHGINITYNVGFPSNEEALEILCRYAFKKTSPSHGFEELAKEVTWLCGNLPLGLRVLGSCLQWENEDKWKYMIRRLQTYIDRDIEDVLRVGYESLHENEQTLFVHIAVFFNHKDVGLVKSMLADDNLDIKFSLEILENRSMIYISTNGEIVIHKLLQQVGMQAIHRQEHSKRRILIDAQEICDVLENDSGTGAVSVSGISFDTSRINEVTVSNKALRRMRNLQFLRVYKRGDAGNDRVHIPEEMEFPSFLRLLHWKAYPNKSLPRKFCLQNLVELDMCDSKLEKLWEGTQPLTNLKKMDLSFSWDLKELPDLSKATNLERLELDGCQSLVELPSSIGSLHKLKKLEMRYCKSLQVIPTHINLASLKKIDMNGCSRLRTFPDFSTNIESLDLMFTAVKEVPASIKHWSHLTTIGVCGNGNLKSFTHYPKGILSLDLSNTDIEKIPDSIHDLKRLEFLYLNCCRKLTSLPKLPRSLKRLEAEECESLESVTSPLNAPRLVFTNCFKLSGEARRLIIQQRLIIQRSYFYYNIAFLPGNVMPSEFNHTARGNSLTFPLSSASSSKFKACVIIPPNHRREGGFVGKIRCIVGSYNEVVHLSLSYDSPAIQTEQLCIFNGVMPEVSSEAKFEFRPELYDGSLCDDYDIIECGVRFITDEREISSEVYNDLESENSYEIIEREISSEDYNDSSYDFELDEVLEDTEDRVINCDSKTENVEKKKKHNCWNDFELDLNKGCWSWVFVFFDLSNIVKNIGSLCWGKETDRIH